VTLHEYLAIAYSLVFSLAAVRLISGLPYAIDRDSRYLVHLAYVAAALFAIAADFWAQWEARDAVWTFPRFLLQLTGPGALYFLACTLIPDDPAAVESWERHFFAARKKIFGTLCAWAFILTVNATVFTDLPLIHPFRGLHLGILALGVAGLSTDRPRAHFMILIFGAIALVIASTVLLSVPPASS